MVIVELSGLGDDLPYSCDEEGKRYYNQGDNQTVISDLNWVLTCNIAESDHRNSLHAPVNRVIKPDKPIIIIQNDIDLISGCRMCQP